ncbi:hypothetical protein SAMN05216323_100257 [Williamwhitmania taraxaci]|uniref:Uncharacterized protein n=1 Tax=Williamwhitmania taraxaci TaxID=1640674 RepID=A0A1G6GM75_9BACT|nr:hypothetical protein SAMN05216323_100257 [Williamwhitmania taraxaci]
MHTSFYQKVDSIILKILAANLKHIKIALA